MQRTHQMKVRVTVEINVPIQTNVESKQEAIDKAVAQAPVNAKSMIGSYINGSYYKRDISKWHTEVLEHSIIALVPTPERVG